MSQAPIPNAVQTSAHSVYIKCLFVTAASTILVAATLGLLSAKLTSAVARNGIVEIGAISTSHAANALGGAIRFNKVDDINDQITRVLEASGGSAIGAVVYGQNGETLGQMASDGADMASLRATANDALMQRVSTTARNGLDVAVPIRFGQDGTLVGVVAIAWTAKPILAALQTERDQTFTISAGVMILMLVLSTLIFRAILGQPLTRLQTAVSAVTDGKYSHAISDTQRKDEIGQLARNLEKMRDGLAAGHQASETTREAQVKQRVVLSTLTNALKALAAGDLTVRIREEFTPEYGQLRADFNATAETLHDTMTAVVSNAETIRAESEEIGEQSSALSRRTENQAATLEETAAALDELTTSVRAAAQGAQDVEKIVQQARSEATDSTTVVSETVTAMSAIESSSNQISTIISVIDDIAFQTNLLALNAGVEAARAGDAGRGFAVVASEVRALAQRSSEAAQQIKTLIGGSSAQVSLGVKLVGDTGVALTAITERVIQISALTSDMASAAGEQSRSLAELNIGVGQLDKATQQNAGMVEAADAASQKLRQQAAELSNLIARFNISAVHGHPVRSRAA